MTWTRSDWIKLSWAKLDSAELSFTELSCLSAAQAQAYIRIRLPRTGGTAPAPRPGRAQTIPRRVFRCASAGIHSDSPALDRRSRVRAAPRARADDPGPRGGDTRPCMRAPRQALPGRYLGVAFGAAGARSSHARALPRRRPWADSGTGALHRSAQTRFGSSSPAPPRLSPPPRRRRRGGAPALRGGRRQSRRARAAPAFCPVEYSPAS